MKKINLFLLILSLSLVFSSCSKQQNENEQPAQVSATVKTDMEKPSDTEEIKSSVPSSSTESASPAPFKEKEDKKPEEGSKITGNKYLTPEGNPLPPNPSDKVYNSLNSEEKVYFDAARNGLTTVRDASIKPFKVLKLLKIKKGDVFADVGSGCGYFTFRVSRLVGKKGKVYAVDINPLAIKFVKTIIEQEKKRTGEDFKNVELVNNTIDELMLPDESLDYAFLCETHIYTNTAIPTGRVIKDHEKAYKAVFEGQKKFTSSIRKALKKKGRLVIIEVKAEFNPHSSLGESDNIKMLEDLGFKLVEKHNVHREYYFIVMEKDESKP